MLGQPLQEVRVGPTGEGPPQCPGVLAASQPFPAATPQPQAELLGVETAPGQARRVVFTCQPDSASQPSPLLLQASFMAVMKA